MLVTNDTPEYVTIPWETKMIRVSRKLILKINNFDPGISKKRPNIAYVFLSQLRESY